MDRYSSTGRSRYDYLTEPSANDSVSQVSNHYYSERDAEIGRARMLERLESNTSRDAAYAAQTPIRASSRIQELSPSVASSHTVRASGSTRGRAMPTSRMIEPPPAPSHSGRSRAPSQSGRSRVTAAAPSQSGRGRAPSVACAPSHSGRSHVPSVARAQSETRSSARSHASAYDKQLVPYDGPPASAADGRSHYSHSSARGMPAQEHTDVRPSRVDDGRSHYSRSSARGMSAPEYADVRPPPAGDHHSQVARRSSVSRPSGSTVRGASAQDYPRQVTRSSSVVRRSGSTTRPFEMSGMRSALPYYYGYPTTPSVEVNVETSVTTADGTRYEHKTNAVAHGSGWQASFYW